MTPTARSMKWLRDRGWEVGRVEQPWNPHRRRTLDLFGFADLIAFRGVETLLVQVTSADNVSSRVNKVGASDIARAWQTGGRLIEVHGWALRGAAGKRKRWTVRRLNCSWTYEAGSGPGFQTTEMPEPRADVERRNPGLADALALEILRGKP